MLDYNSSKYNSGDVEYNNNNNVKNGKTVQQKEETAAVYSSNLQGVLAQVKRNFRREARDTLGPSARSTRQDA